MWEERHRCTGNVRECEYAAICEECGVSATRGRPVVMLRHRQDGEYVFTCAKHDPRN